ncbi:MAG: hypothetical protein QGM47_11135, partial [Actinomycetota bacterium]|nr:hypothetical protein [Actinomycetota bacterium]
MSVRLLVTQAPDSGISTTWPAAPGIVDNPKLPSQHHSRADHHLPGPASLTGRATGTTYFANRSEA